MLWFYAILNVRFVEAIFFLVVVYEAPKWPEAKRRVLLIHIIGAV